MPRARAIAVLLAAMPRAGCGHQTDQWELVSHTHPDLVLKVGWLITYVTHRDNKAPYAEDWLAPAFQPLPLPQHSTKGRSRNSHTSSMPHSAVSYIRVSQASCPVDHECLCLISAREQGLFTLTAWSAPLQRTSWTKEGLIPLTSLWVGKSCGPSAASSTKKIACPGFISLAKIKIP